uniref:Apple domain-containing protein n=1 Tax=Pristionchus pacificus TaxID=54126 RepID=A0A8R1U8D3_PRIPA
MSSTILKIAAFGCILTVVGAELARDKRQLFADSFGSSVVDPYVDQPLFAAAPRVVYRRPTAVVQRPSYYPELYSQPLVRAYRPMYRQVVPQVYAEPQPVIIQRRPSFAVAAPVPYMAHSALASDILIKKKKLSHALNGARAAIGAVCFISQAETIPREGLKIFKSNSLPSCKIACLQDTQCQSIAYNSTLKLCVFHGDPVDKIIVLSGPMEHTSPSITTSSIAFSGIQLSIHTLYSVAAIDPVYSAVCVYYAADGPPECSYAALPSAPPGTITPAVPPSPMCTGQMRHNFGLGGTAGTSNGNATFMRCLGQKWITFPNVNGGVQNSIEIKAASCL